MPATTETVSQAKIHNSADARPLYRRRESMVGNCRVVTMTEMKRMKPCAGESIYKKSGGEYLSYDGSNRR